MAVTRIRKTSGPPLYCDTGRYAGMSRVDIALSVYLTAEETAQYNGDFQIIVGGHMMINEEDNGKDH